ncbi:MAG: DUF952 domain-containing protein [Candidatus Binataceae bacterium]|jgi:uncharacterized protein (DUF952 family)
MIFHIVGRADWDYARRRGVYRPPSLAAEGFIHCSTSKQVVDTANLFYRGRSDLVLLIIDETRIAAPLRYEMPLAAGDMRAALTFPHIYGPLNLDAVIRIEDLPCEADGTFQSPSSLQSIA